MAQKRNSSKKKNSTAAAAKRTAAGQGTAAASASEGRSGRGTDNSGGTESESGSRSAGSGSGSGKSGGSGSGSGKAGSRQAGSSSGKTGSKSSGRRSQSSSRSTRPNKETKRAAAKKKSFLKKEVLSIALVAAGCILILAELGLMGVPGRAFRSLQAGLFGQAGLLFGVTLLAAAVTAYMERGHELRNLKLVSVFGLFIIITAIVQLIFGEKPEETDSIVISFAELYRLGADGGAGGGAVGGVIAYTLWSVIGAAGAWLLLIVAALIFAVVISERSIMAVAGAGAAKTADAVRYGAARTAEAAGRTRERRAEERRRRREQELKDREAAAAAGQAGDGYGDGAGGSYGNKAGVGYGAGAGFGTGAGGGYSAEAGDGYGAGGGYGYGTGAGDRYGAGAGGGYGAEAGDGYGTGAGYGYGTGAGGGYGAEAGDGYGSNAGDGYGIKPGGQAAAEGTGEGPGIGMAAETAYGNKAYGGAGMEGGASDEQRGTGYYGAGHRKASGEYDPDGVSRYAREVVGSMPRDESADGKPRSGGGEVGRTDGGQDYGYGYGYGYNSYGAVQDPGHEAGGAADSGVETGGGAARLSGLPTEEDYESDTVPFEETKEERYKSYAGLSGIINIGAGSAEGFAVGRGAAGGAAGFAVGRGTAGREPAPGTGATGERRYEYGTGAGSGAVAAGDRWYEYGSGGEPGAGGGAVAADIAGTTGTLGYTCTPTRDAIGGYGRDGSSMSGTRGAADYTYGAGAVSSSGSVPGSGSANEAIYGAAGDRGSVPVAETGRDYGSSEDRERAPGTGAAGERRYEYGFGAGNGADAAGERRYEYGSGGEPGAGGGAGASEGREPVSGIGAGSGLGAAGGGIAVSGLTDNAGAGAIAGSGSGATGDSGYRSGPGDSVNPGAARQQEDEPCQGSMQGTRIMSGLNGTDDGGFRAWDWRTELREEAEEPDEDVVVLGTGSAPNNTGAQSGNSGDAVYNYAAGSGDPDSVLYNTGTQAGDTDGALYNAGARAGGADGASYNTGTRAGSAGGTHYNRGVTAAGADSVVYKPGTLSDPKAESGYRPDAAALSSGATADIKGSVVDAHGGLYGSGYGTIAVGNGTSAACCNAPAVDNSTPVADDGTTIDDYDAQSAGYGTSTADDGVPDTCGDNAAKGKGPGSSVSRQPYGDEYGDDSYYAGRDRIREGSRGFFRYEGNPEEPDEDADYRTVYRDPELYNEDDESLSEGMEDDSGDQEAIAGTADGAGSRSSQTAAGDSYGWRGGRSYAASGLKVGWKSEGSRGSGVDPAAEDEYVSAREKATAARQRDADPGRSQSADSAMGGREMPQERSGAVMRPGTGAPSGGAGSRDGAVSAPRAGAEAVDPEKQEKKKYIFPDKELLEKGEAAASDTGEEVRRNAAKLQQVLRDFGVGVTVTNVIRGPRVSRYEILPDTGVKVSRITSLSGDIKLALAAAEMRIEAPIPGKSAVGIEIPNRQSRTVRFRDILESEEFKKAGSLLSWGIGLDIQGSPVIADIAKMPHVLVAGTTGSGKSVGINSLIMSILYKATPEQVRMILIDPKVVELSVYNGIPHLLTEVVTKPDKALTALNWAVAEMNNRYRLFQQSATRNIAGYNKKIEQVNSRLPEDTPEEEKAKKLPYILIIIDELSELMLHAKKDVETAIVSITQLARAAGIHLVVATQRPSVDVITGLIKSNIPSRIAYRLPSATDSRTILDSGGAENLLGNGDMLFKPGDRNSPARVQGAFLSDAEVEAVVDFLRSENIGSGDNYSIDEAMNTQMELDTGSSGGDGRSQGPDRDEYFGDAGRFVINTKKASIGALQRKFKIGFNRAARIMDQLCEAGAVSESEGTKERQILMDIGEFEELLQ